MTSSKKPELLLLFATLIVISGAALLFVQKKELYSFSALVGRNYSIEVDPATEYSNSASVFKPKVVYYNRVGKCGSRSLLSVIKESS